MRLLAIAALLTLTGGTIAEAATVLDPAGDYAIGYSGTAGADLDVRSFTVNYDGVTNLFALGATFDGPINNATPGTYVIGVNTGAGALGNFTAQGAPNVHFDTTFRINKDGTTTLAGGYTALISGSGFTITLPASLFTSTGATPERYGFNLWPRTGVGTGTVITDFAPNDSVLAAVPAPEPTSWIMLLTGFGAIGAVLRKRRASGAALA